VVSEPVFDIVYPSWQPLQRDCQQQIRMRGLLLKTEAEPEQFTPVRVRLRAPNGRSFDLVGQVVQVVAGQGVAVQFGADAAETIAELEQTCADGRDGRGAGEPEEPQVFAPGESPPSAAGPAGDDQPAHVQIEQMSVNEKRRAALRGRRDMRLLLIRDKNKTVHPFVLRNPGITLDEVEQIAKMPGVNPDALRMIAGNRDWIRSTTVCRNLVRNPKTPMPDALRLLGKLPMSDLRAMAKSGNVRTPIQQAARKKVTG
jgi:hypothetical protein